MYEKGLTAADLKAISKSRGFSSEEVAFSTLFESAFLSEKGLESALASLTQEEIVLLNILNFMNKAVGVTYFKYLYGDQEKESNAWHYQSFATQYKDIFKQVRVSLIRKGVLLFAESANTWVRTTKLERWRFRFPKEFYPFLPTSFRYPTIFDASCGVSKDILRRKLKQVVAGAQIPDESTGYEIKLADGKLYINGHEFRLKYLKKWQIESWQASVPNKDKTKKDGISPLQLVIYALSQLNQNEWILPEDILRFWNILYPEEKAPDSRIICETGWNWGFLAKHESDGRSFYRLAGTSDAQMPERYLTVIGDQTVVIDLKTIPFENLELLARISKMEVGDSRLQISPDLIAIGNAPTHIRNHPQTLWLRNNSSLFREVLEKVDKTWGKLVIHENLLVARIKDLSLLVKLQRSFPDQVKPLSKNFIAFPRDVVPEIQKLVEGSGYVIKTVKDEKYGEKNKRD